VKKGKKYIRPVSEVLVFIEIDRCTDSIKIPFCEQIFSAGRVVFTTERMFRILCLKFEASIPDEVFVFFNLPNSFFRTMALG
jgi:hypothetical protein